MNALLIGRPLWIGGRTGEEAAFGNRLDSILGDGDSGGDRLERDMSALAALMVLDTGTKSIGGCFSKPRCGLNPWLFRLLVLGELMLSLSLRVSPNARDCFVSGKPARSELSYRLATLGIGGRTGGCRLTMLFRFPAMPRPSLVFRRRLSSLGM